MTVSERPKLRDRIDEVDRRIEHLQSQIEALEAVKAQLQAELAFSRLFPASSGFAPE